MNTQLNTHAGKGFTQNPKAQAWGRGIVTQKKIASRLLNPVELNYYITEREAPAVVLAVNKFGDYIERTPITVPTNHQALKWLMSLKSPTSKLARRALQLQAYDLTIKFINGKTSVVADALSRSNCDLKSQEKR